MAEQDQDKLLRRPAWVDSKDLPLSLIPFKKKRSARLEDILSGSNQFNKYAYEMYRREYLEYE